jgi:calreticulin
MPAGLDQKDFKGESTYAIMFGPDICGYTKKIHLIFNYKGKNLLWKKEPKAESDEYTHTYTAIVHPDNTYEVQVDGKRVEGGNLADDWDFLGPKKIKDPNQSKPSDWVDAREIVDPNDKKPEGWDSIPAQIVDPKAEKPEGWNDADDGEWEPPMIDNPEFKGPWKAKMIPNPEYKGEWVHPEIDNPDYHEDPNLYLQKSLAFVGFDLWQVKSGTIFDRVILTDSTDEAKAFAKPTEKLQAVEKEHKDKEAAKAKEAADKAAAEAAAKKAEEDKNKKSEDGEAKEKADL